MNRILVVDDERNVVDSIRKVFTKDGHDVLTARSGLEALRLLERERPDLILLDIRMAGLTGLETLERAKTLAPDVPVILMTAYGTTENAIEAMKRGAFEFVLKPFEVPELKTLVEKALKSGAASKRDESAGAATNGDEEPRIVGMSPKMCEVYKLIGQVAPSQVTVLIRGESGTGKELVARALHEHSPRAGRPFVAVNCSAIPEALLESELFGYEKGAFTGATARRAGKFEQAQGGTIFLDEVGDMTPSTQAKVLRVLQDQSFERLGGRETIRVSVRVLAATNRNLEALLASGRFREDLYYRLHVVNILLPPLRERKEDIPALTGYFLQRFGSEFGRSGVRASPEALARLRAHAWPGNVRELEHCLKQAVVLSKGNVILPEHLRLDAVLVPVPPRTGKGAESLGALARTHLASSPGLAHERLIEQVERELLEEALKKTGGNLAQASKLVGLSRPTFREKAVRYGLRRHGEADENGEAENGKP